MASPTPKDTLLTYDRGSQAPIITGATTTVLQVGTAQPLGANAYGLPAVIQRGQMNPNYAVQIDINLASGTGAFSALVVNILGSLDGINYYIIYTITTATGGIFFAAGAGQVRYLSASITTATVGSGAPTATISFCE